MAKSQLLCSENLHVIHSLSLSTADMCVVSGPTDLRGFLFGP